jgi:hypothetical protein
MTAGSAPTVPDSPMLAPDYAPAPSRLHLLAPPFAEFSSSLWFIPGVVVFGWFRRREKPKVFLGMIVIVPRTGIKPHFDQFGVFGNEELETSLRAALHEIFSLPPASEVLAPLPTDLGLDVFIPSFQAGGVWNLSLGDSNIPIFFPFFWRPKITVTCRLYYLQSQKTKRAFSVTKKMRWREFFGRQFTLRAFFNYRPTFDAEDMKRLLNLACHSVLDKLTKAI